MVSAGGDTSSIGDGGEVKLDAPAVVVELVPPVPVRFRPCKDVRKVRR